MPAEQEGGPVQQRLMRRCPFIDDPCDHCYVTKLDSRSVERAISYCGGKYEECTIYMSLVWKLQREENDAAADAPASADRRSAVAPPAGRKKQP